jgi:hypothetical protein
MDRFQANLAETRLPNKTVPTADKADLFGSPVTTNYSYGKFNYTNRHVTGPQSTEKAMGTINNYSTFVTVLQQSAE